MDVVSEVHKCLIYSDTFLGGRLNECAPKVHSKVLTLYVARNNAVGFYDEKVVCGGEQRHTLYPDLALRLKVTLIGN